MFLEMFLKVRKEKEVVWYECNTIPEKRGKEILLFYKAGFIHRGSLDSKYLQASLAAHS